MTQLRNIVPGDEGVTINFINYIMKMIKLGRLR
jgi:hypothetical protein